jgi:type I restriction enzyme, S subunit
VSDKNEHQILPNGWEWISIGETGEYINGFAFKPSHRDAGGLPIVRIQNLTNESKPLNTTTIEVPSDYKIDTGDMLMSWSATLDVFVWQRGPALVNQHIFKVVPDERVMSKSLLFYWLKQAIQELQKTDHLHGSTMMHINRGPFMAHRVPLPPAAEQTRIVAKLEELISDHDAGVEELKTAQKKLARYRQSLLKAAVEGTLTAEWRNKNTPTENGAQLLQRILTERRVRWEAKQLAKFKEQGKTPPKDWQKKYPVPVQPLNTNYTRLPEGWVWATVDQLAAIGTGVTPLKSKSQYYVGGDIPWVTSGALNNEMVTEATEYVTPLALKDCRLESYPAGSLLVAMYGEGKTRGKCSELAMSATINQAIAALVFEDAASVCKPYIKSFLLKSYDDMRNQASGGVQPNMNLQIVRSIAIPIPPVDEQNEITRILSSQLEAAKDQVTAIDLSLQQSTAQRQNILRTAFAGQLVPQDPNDEPASVLMERIRLERAIQQMQPKIRNSKKNKRMNSSDAVTLLDWVKARTVDDFSFDDLRGGIAGDYEALKDSVFQLLAADQPIIEQFFDTEAGTLRFRKVTR